MYSFKLIFPQHEVDWINISIMIVIIAYRCPVTYLNFIGNMVLKVAKLRTKLEPFHPEHLPMVSRSCTDKPSQFTIYLRALNWPQRQHKRWNGVPAINKTMSWKKKRIVDSFFVIQGREAIWRWQIWSKPAPYQIAQVAPTLQRECIIETPLVRTSRTPVDYENK